MKKCSAIFILGLLLLTKCSSGPDRSIDRNGPAEITKRQKTIKTDRLGDGKKDFSLVGNSALLQTKRLAEKVKMTNKRPVQQFEREGQLSLRERNQRIEMLRRHNTVPDLNEPVTRRSMNQLLFDTLFRSMITLSPESFLTINFDNDILNYTDRFYTNGIKIDWISPALRFNPLRRLMIPYWGGGVNYYGLSLVQNMYTPSTTKIGGILYGDRPYSAYLSLGSYKITNDPVHRFRQTSEIIAGIIGPGSNGEWVQRAFHNSVPTNHEPLGWEYQVKNDLVLNYTLTYEKGVYSGRNLDLQLNAATQLGTLYCNTSGGAMVRAGWFNPWFSNLGIARKRDLIAGKLRRFQVYFFARGSGRLVGYDATLQGGIFNKSSIYVIPAADLNRLVFQSSAGVSVSVDGFRLNFEQFLLSPEFRDGLWHKWVHLSLFFAL